jgi:hypothetical protein
MSYRVTWRTPLDSNYFMNADIYTPICREEGAQSIYCLHFPPSAVAASKKFSPRLLLVASGYRNHHVRQLLLLWANAAASALRLWFTLPVATVRSWRASLPVWSRRSKYRSNMGRSQKIVDFFIISYLKLDMKRGLSRETEKKIILPNSVIFIPVCTVQHRDPFFKLAFT